MRVPESPARADVVVRGFSELWDGERVWSRAAVAFHGGRTAWVGGQDDAPPAARVVDVEGALGMPGLVDCHTHTTFAGTRAGDFARRLAGEGYTAILEAGGGIHATVRATRAASLAELTALTRARLAGMLRRGVTTVEVKSGYGLAWAPEQRMLEAARAAAGPVEVVPTYLAHVLPPDREREAYVDEIVREHLPGAVGCAVDVYCDRGAFTLEETRRILAAGKALGRVLRVHAEQVTCTGAAALAASLGAASADHLERIDDAGIDAMARAGTVAVLLPGAMLYLRDSAPPVARLRAAGVPLAVATDFNPGSSPVRDLWAAATLACLTMGLTIPEALGAVTRQAGRALGRPDLGWLGAGSAGDLAAFHPPPGEPADLRVLVQYLGGHDAALVVKSGQVVTPPPSETGDDARRAG